MCIIFLALFLISSHPQIMILCSLLIFFTFLIKVKVGVNPLIPGIAETVKSTFYLNSTNLYHLKL